MTVCTLAESPRDFILEETNMFLFLRSWMDTGLKKPFNRSSAIAEHLLNNSDCARDYSDSNFSIIIKALNDYHLSKDKLFRVKIK